MRFSDPQYFHFLWLVPALGLLLWAAARRRHRLLSHFATIKLTRRLAVPFLTGVRGLRVTALLAALALLIVALARPQYGKQAVILKREGRDIVFLLDTSLSMLADDIKPDRLSRARFEITSLLSRLEGDRVSLVPFAGDAFVLCPLTTDYSALALFMDGVDTDIISQPGTNIARALESGVEAFDRKEREYRVMILITDGEQLEGDALEIARKISQQGIRLYAIGIGTQDGVPIPVRDSRGSMPGGANITAQAGTQSNSTVFSRISRNLKKGSWNPASSAFITTATSGFSPRCSCFCSLNRSWWRLAGKKRKVPAVSKARFNKPWIEMVLWLG